MTTQHPRVLVLEEFLELRKPLRERPEPLVYFTDEQFTRLVEGAVELDRLPRFTTPLATFVPSPGGGMVPSRCERPPQRTAPV